MSRLMSKSTPRPLAAIALLLASATAVMLEGTPTVATDSQAPAATTVQLDRLTLDVQRATGVRDVKRLQSVYAQFAEYGMWNQVADLFAERADAIFDETVLHGREEIRRYLVTTLGRGRDGMPVGGIFTQILQAPVVTLSEDGNRATGRWQDLTMRGQFGEQARWTGGFQVNDFVKEGGVWKIARLNYVHQFEGAYETGWKIVRPKNAFVPYHFTPAQAGKPVPDLPATIPASAPKTAAQTAAALTTLERQIMKLNEEDKIRNLQAIYGYYVDRKMWDDVTDLFTQDSAYERAGVGIYRGPAGVRKAMESEGGPISLRDGEIHDHLQLGIVVTIADSGVEAQARGLELSMLTPNNPQGYWAVSTFENHYAKIDGAWRIREMRIFPKMKTDYKVGWAKSRVIDPVPTGPLAPDQPSATDSPQVSAVVPVFNFPNPASGRPVTYPAGLRPVGADRLVQAAAPPAMPLPSGDVPTRLADAARKLAVSKAYDAIDNISSAFGYYLDDFQWQAYVENYSTSGRRKKGSGGFYVGRQHIFQVEAMGYGHMPPDRDSIRVHTRVQPVIDVAPDAKTAYIRTRMLLYFANPRTPAASFNSGMYPNDSAVLEDGIWKFNVGGSIDETYFNGWTARPTLEGEMVGGGRGARGGGRGAAAAAGPRPPSDGTGLANTRLGGRAPVGVVSTPQLDFPADASYDDMPYRGQGFVSTFPNYRNWPQIKPMWFHYKNPVSGRIPEFYCPDILTCDAEYRAGKLKLDSKR